MKTHDDFLVEILTEELPPKTLLSLANAFQQQLSVGLEKAQLTFSRSQFFATPRRLAVRVERLVAMQPGQLIERRGPALEAAFDAHGQPTPACVGFARSCGVAPQALITLKNQQGSWVGYQHASPGKSTISLLPEIVQQALQHVPLQKRMRWGEHAHEFVRPIHRIVLLYGDQAIPATILGVSTSQQTQGHRFHAPQPIAIAHPRDYPALLEAGYVIADFNRRRELIRERAIAAIADLPGATLHMDPSLVDEVTGIVEWPIAIRGDFDEKYLSLPMEVLISAMQDHQRYFPVLNSQGQLLPYFVAITAIESKDQRRLIQGNERVLRARLSDAAFFYETDQKESLAARIPRLQQIIFQAKLGTLYDKAERLSKLAAWLAPQLGVDEAEAARAGWLAKVDLMTHMVGEFPELQGTMGYYYALHDQEPQQVALAIKEHYLPRFSGDDLPASHLGSILAIAERLDTLVGAFGTHQIPTGDKDPFGLRRAAVGLLRILIEQEQDLDLNVLVDFAVRTYSHPLENKEVTPQLLKFLQERLRAWYQEQGVTADIFAAVAALEITRPVDMHRRIQAVKAFKALNEAAALSIANKRVSNILAKYEETFQATAIDAALFEQEAEHTLAQQIEQKSRDVAPLYQAANYGEVLLQLASLRQPVDDFFAQVMVMSDNKLQRENRLLLLAKLRTLFLQVADIALLH